MRSSGTKRQPKTRVAPIAPRRPDPGHPAREARAEARARKRRERLDARRFTRHTRHRRYTSLTVIALLTAMVAILAVAIFSPLLALRTVRIEGTTTLSPATVRAAVSDQLGTPLALLDEGRIHRNLAKFTLIRSYTTTIVPPNTLIVRVVERTAIGVVAHGSRYQRVDAAGVVLGSSATPGGLPIIAIGSFKPGSAAFDSVVRVLLAMPSSVLHLVQTVSASTQDDVSVTLTGATNTVVWGSASQSALKAQALARLLQRPECTTQAVIDVSAPEFAGCGPAHVAPTPAPTPSTTATPGQ